MALLSTLSGNKLVVWFPVQLPELCVPVWHFRTGSVPELHSSDIEMHRTLAEWPGILLMIPFTNICLSVIPRNIFKWSWCFILTSISMCSEWHSTQGCCEQAWNAGNHISAVGDWWLTTGVQPQWSQGFSKGRRLRRSGYDRIKDIKNDQIRIAQWENSAEKRGWITWFMWKANKIPK